MGHDAVYDIAVRVLKDKRQIWVFLAREIKVFEEPLSVSSAVHVVDLRADNSTG